MRAVILGVLVLLPILLLGPAGGQPPTPPAGCSGPACTVASTVAAYAPPVVVVPSGGSVRWVAVDEPHTTTEDLQRGLPTPCFDVSFAPTRDGQARFEVRPDGLYAVTRSLVGGELVEVERRCDTAVPLVGGGHAVGYACRVSGHIYQRGIVVVVPLPA